MGTEQVAIECISVHIESSLSRRDPRKCLDQFGSFRLTKKRQSFSFINVSTIKRSIQRWIETKVNAIWTSLRGKCTRKVRFLKRRLPDINETRRAIGPRASGPFFQHGKIDPKIVRRSTTSKESTTRKEHGRVYGRNNKTSPACNVRRGWSLTSSAISFPRLKEGRKVFGTVRRLPVASRCPSILPPPPSSRLSDLNFEFYGKREDIRRLGNLD